MEIMYHGTLAKNHASIMEHGILARNTTEHNYPYMSENRDVNAVYVFNQYNPDRGWQYTSEPDWIVYAVDVTDLPRDSDPGINAPWSADLHEDGTPKLGQRWAYRIRADIPPSRIRAVLVNPRSFIPSPILTCSDKIPSGDVT